MPPKPSIRTRATEVSRVEAFSDVVFGFALTLIVISLEVPRTFAELAEAMRGFVAFTICFAILVWIWHAHYTFFRRFGLQDSYTIVLNTVLLFLVLFYIYPLKFLFSLLTGGLAKGAVTRGDMITLMVIYGVGFAGLFTVFSLLYLHAYKQREALELSELELAFTRKYMLMYVGYVGIGLLSTLLALTLPGRLIAFSGLSYFLIGPVSALVWTIRPINVPATG
ncbi:MAG TPA: TMEM175 family protein [Thermoanaerobaculia bacterium]